MQRRSQAANPQLVGLTLLSGVAGRYRKGGASLPLGGQGARSRRTGRFDYRVSLPDNVDADKIEANLAEGVLTVRVPKSERAQRRRIEVKPYDDGGAGFSRSLVVTSERRSYYRTT
jgi:hypothetical protein